VCGWPPRGRRQNGNGCRVASPQTLARTVRWAASASGYDADDLGILGEPTKRLLGESYTAVYADLKRAPTGPLQSHLSIWSDLSDQGRRRTGARFIVSLAAVFDFNFHFLPSSSCLG
jgi:hypothetical protein